MLQLETILLLFLAAVALAALARRVGAPYPVFLALGGIALAFLPCGARFSVPPELALALFVAPVLLDAAYDTSLRDLLRNWLPISSLVIVAVILTTAAVSIVARAFIPGLPWAVAIALGAVVAPPDAIAASAVLQPLKPPHRILTILEGESLLNDASALLIFRVSVGVRVRVPPRAPARETRLQKKGPASPADAGPEPTHCKRLELPVNSGHEHAGSIADVARADG